MKTLARGPDVLLMRNVDTPFDIHATGVEYSKPSEQGMDEIGSAADYITRQVGERAIFIGTSSWTRRSQVAGDLLGSMLPRVEGIGQFGFTEETGVSSMSLEELARREADGMRDFLYYRQLFLGHNPKKLPPVAVLVATGASIDRHVGFGFSWRQGHVESPWQSTLEEEQELSGQVLIPTGSVLHAPERTPSDRFVIRGHGVDLLARYLADRDGRNE